MNYTLTAEKGVNQRLHKNETRGKIIVKNL